MIKRIIGTLFAWATLALIVIVVLHRGRYTSLVEFRTEEPAAAEPACMPSAPLAVPDSVKLPAAGVLPADKPDSAGMAAEPAVEPLPASDTTASDASASVLVEPVVESQPAEKPDSAGIVAASGGEL